MPKSYSKEILKKAYDLITIKKYSANKAAQELGIDCGSMRNRLKKDFGLTFLPNGKKQIDSNFFNTIDSEEKAYWLGFLTADGYINEKNSIELALAEIDKKHVEKFKKALKSEHKITKKTTKLNNKKFISYRVCFKDSNISKCLKNLGLNNTKSYTAYIPNIPDNLKRHYLRGLFDGDGSIYNYKTKNKIRNEVSIVSASKKMIDNIYDVVQKNTQIVMKYRKSRELHELRIYNQFQIKIFLKWLYEDSTIYLDRKNDKAIAVLSQKPLKTQED